MTTMMYAVHTCHIAVIVLLKNSWLRFPKRSGLIARKMSSYGVGISEETRSYATAKNAVIIDLRSDTLTKPSEAMKMAMYNADLGDDVYGEDPTVKKLEKKAADLLGKEAAVFVTSGTMGNLIAIMNHCDVRGSEAYCGEESHTNLHEQGGAAQLGGVTLSTLPNESNGTFDLKKLESKLRSDRLHEPISKLVIVENTINGKVLPQSWIDDLVILAKKRNLKLHMDGARLWNASVASGIPAKDIVSGFDSVTFCLSKGLGAPVGSLLCGSKSFVERARRIRKVLGGGMRQVGVLAAAGLVAIDEVIPILKDDHRRAASIMTAINEMKSRIFSVDSKTTHTNMVMVTLNGCSAKKFAERLQLVADDDNDDDKAIVKSLALNESLVRFVLYHEINDELLNSVIRKVRYVIKELDPVLNS
ncbi:probable low-specificity L-threonine aldolase 2 isoform X2 [Cephus cinctus]|uniref:Probable low-specificity L-threonine aldolase 2 isoform X2 n=1 Tax=Cephus cinctus TaxID=211228 RepID=A0AAJ7VZ78_CEPCN|nr:probable low-specificity L-threonine aldolase 2 isoform X2 [Cephus cinctus]